MKLSLLIASRPVTAEISLNDIETKRIVWYKQPVDNHTGKLYGEAVGFQGFNSVNTSWFQAALHNSWGYSSVENEWNSGVGPLFLTSVGILGRAVVSLGVPVKRLTHLFSATQRIRTEEGKYGVHIPIIALTANTSGKEEMEAGMDFHLVKPLKSNELMSH
ncbi:hypothetical protein V6N12_001868 [Hibiscus sabdariffa]|uniref:Uncharacterized protein n=1 Tax=Hibiscus sabdariffa TaxID=183260 RepID=A0ABR2BRM4_9ROSI